MTSSAAPAPVTSSLSLIQKGPAPKPSRILLYGIHGIGKTSFAATAPSPIFICTEEGAGELDVHRFPLCETREQVIANLRALYSEKHEYQTVVIDTADWLEDMIFRDLQANTDPKELAYGKESILAEEKMSEVLNALNFLRDRKGMTVIIVAHTEIKRFNSPMTEPYDRYQPKLQSRTSALLQEWADAVFFATYDVSVKKEDVGFNQKVRRGVSAGDRIMYTEERPAYYAKNRYQLPPELPLSWKDFAAAMPFYGGKTPTTQDQF